LGGEETRDFVCVDDVIAANILASDSSTVIFNIACVRG
jgi:nucleoside-diphosphate-sugar epimerase